MNRHELATIVDHTLLKQTATWDDIRELCDEAVAFHTASVCIPPCYVEQASKYLDGKIPVCTVIGFPNGNTTTANKLAETLEALDNGAQEFDMVINIGMLKAGEDGYVAEEIRQLKRAVGSRTLKVIVETGLLDEDEKIRMCRIVTESGADFIKTSTGFAGSGATFEDIALFAKHVGKNVKIKASGGIATLEDAQHFVDLGASRLGTSKVVKLLQAKEAQEGY